MTQIKNCGMKTTDAIECAIHNGAAFIGFIHYIKSRRYISFLAAQQLSANRPEAVKSVAVLVNPTDEDIAQAAYADLLQLHGDETPERVAEVKALSGKPVIKAIGIADAFDLMKVGQYEPVADMLLLDTKHESYGGTGTSFDWSLLQGTQFSKPWFLSGGLDAGNIAAALATTHAPMVDASSGIDSAPALKDLEKIKQFNQAVQAYDSQ